MPELPDVEIFRRYLESTSMHQPIEHVHVEAPDLLEETTPQGLGRALKGKGFVDTRRHGKYLFGGLEGGPWLLLHFGMTGYLDYARDGAASPEHTRLRVDFTNGAWLAYVAPRKLGRIRLVEDVEAYVEDAGLGPDAASLGAGAFRDLLRKHRGMIKSLLMNQEAIAGLGNVYTDEALFQAGIHPKAKLGELSDEQIDGLYRAIGRVIERAVEADADIARMPDSWLLPRREEGRDCPRCGGSIRQIAAAGRTAYFCPRCQPEPS